MEKIGKQTIKFDNPPTILECASIVGPKEGPTMLAHSKIVGGLSNFIVCFPIFSKKSSPIKINF